MKITTLNREISWLSFNERVLQEASDKKVPLIERLRFLGIFSGNLDEFFRVRVATLRRLLDLDKGKDVKINFDPSEILHRIYEINTRLQLRFGLVQDELFRGLEGENIFRLDENTMNAFQQEVVKKHFTEHIQTNLFPVMIKNLDEIPLLQDREVYLGIHLKNTKKQKESYAIIRIPAGGAQRFFVFPADSDSNDYFILIDDIIRFNLQKIFQGLNFDYFRAYSVFLTRDSELDIDKNIKRSFIKRVNESLQKRKQGRPVRFEYDRQMPGELLEMLTSRFGISETDTLIPGGRYHNFSHYREFPGTGRPDLEYNPLPGLAHGAFQGRDNIFSAIRKNDILLHFPYHSFSYVIDWLRQASIDPKVKSVKMTVYRLAADSRVIHYLINAARNGKKVTVFIELQARFDELNNIHWSQILQKEGVRVIHGTAGIKVHCKLILIRRKEKRKNVLYAGISTGNFNENTANHYTDLCLLTFNGKITREVEKIFNVLDKSFFPLVSFRQLIVSPFQTRKTMLRLIGREIRNAKAGKPARIMLKLNSLMDEALVKKLYQASAAGVKCQLIVRGICVLEPGIPGLSDNIEVRSIVDRFLEHARIFVFHNQGEQEVFISSADMMIRNLDYRVEVTCPVTDNRLREDLLTIMQMQWEDNQKARLIEPKMLNHYVDSRQEPPFRSQTAIYEYYKQKLHN